MDDILRRRAFFRGLLYALCTIANEEEFIAEGPEYHRAFAETLRYARNIADEGRGPAPIELHVDPLFGVYREANEMLLEGEQDLLLSLINPTLRRATFRIRPGEAERRLSGLPDQAWYRDLASHFYEQLRT
jgi:hypothetical protein